MQRIMEECKRRNTDEIKLDVSHFSILYLNAIEKLETLLAYCKKYLFEFAS